jgi:signal transduction histidine kinase
MMRLPNGERYSRDRVIVLTIVLAILVACLVYAVIAINAATALRRKHALDRNLTTAQLSARLLDEQWDDVISVLDVLANRDSLLAELQRNDVAHVRQDLRYAVDLVPSLLFAAAYRPDGSLIASCFDRHIVPVHPGAPTPPRNVAAVGWFQSVAATRNVYQSDVISLPDIHSTEVIAVAVPVGHGPHPSGYLLVYYRLGDIDAWLQQLHMSGGVLYIVRADGHILDATGTASNRRFGIISHPALQRAIQHQEGALVAENVANGGQAVIGYSYAAKPRWAVLVVQAIAVANAPTNYVVVRLSTLAGVVLALLVLAGYTLDRLYRRQDRLALLLETQNERLRAADQARSNFLANVSHDLRTPLASVRLSLSGLLDSELVWEPDQVRECLRVADEGLDQLTSRVSNLLEMTRLEAGAWPLHIEVCDLTDLVSTVLERMAPLLARRPVTLAFPSEAILVECDPAQIETVIVNLLDNALRYTEEGSPLTLRGEAWLDAAVFCLEDHGQGIPDGDKEHIFEKFYRSRAHTATDGTGLGLAICRTIIEAHLGRIGVRNAPEGGAEFWFSLPRYLSEEAYRP